MMGVVFDVLFRVVFDTALYALWPARRGRTTSARPGAGLHARRHVVASYRAWARRGGWTAVEDTLEGTMRGVAATVRPHLEDDTPGAIEVKLAASVGRAPATLRPPRDAEALIPALAPLFVDGALTRIRWTGKTVDFRFAPLTMPETVAETCAAALTALMTPAAPYR